MGKKPYADYTALVLLFLEMQLELEKERLLSRQHSAFSIQRVRSLLFRTAGDHRYETKVDGG